MSKKENENFGFKVPGKNGTGGSQALDPSNLEGSYKQLLGDKPITWFWLMQHYSKENAAAYKAQKEARKRRKSNPEPELKKEVSEVRSETNDRRSPDRESVERKEEISGGTVFVRHEIDRMPEADLDCLSYHQKVAISKRTFLIGRNSPDADLKMVDAPTVSGLHAEISYSDGMFYIEDLNSLNGVYLDGEKIRPSVKTALRDGITITLGEEKLIFRLSGSY